MRMPSRLASARRSVCSIISSAASPFLLLQLQEGGAMLDVVGGDRHVVDDVLDLAGEGRRRHHGERARHVAATSSAKPAENRYFLIESIPILIPVRGYFMRSERTIRARFMRQNDVADASCIASMAAGRRAEIADRAERHVEADVLRQLPASLRSRVSENVIR